MRVTRDANGGLIAKSLGRRVLLPWAKMQAIFAWRQSSIDVAC